MDVLLGVTTATLIAAVSAAGTIGAFVAYVYYLRRSGGENAREEALALAETRGAIITDLQAQLRSVQRERERAERAYETRIKELERALAAAKAESREQAYQMQRFYTAAFAGFARRRTSRPRGRPAQRGRRPYAYKGTPRRRAAGRVDPRPFDDPQSSPGRTRTCNPPVNSRLDRGDDRRKPHAYVVSPPLGCPGIT